MMTESRASFRVGQIVRHRLFDYRGVIVDVDPQFLGTEEWYRVMARTRPPRDRPWYHVLVHGARHMTYVAERNLRPDADEAPVDHPEIATYFAGFEGGRYVPRRGPN